MGKTIALVACVAGKADRPRPAGSLYTSAWFRKASAYAEREADAWYILSAKYGLVGPEEVIAPYNETLNTMPVAERRAWAKRVLRALLDVVLPGDRVIMLAGIRYREHLVGSLETMGCEVEVPMEGLGIGKQLQWLTQRL